MINKLNKTANMCAICEGVREHMLSRLLAVLLYLITESEGDWQSPVFNPIVYIILQSHSPFYDQSHYSYRPTLPEKRLGVLKLIFS